ncbi:unnamed protein product [Allacma fusca]|uniref:Uncharacterized protein n=1 Tax=Allacma fusca TaxID=39272 RepID=A0A8J2PR11_9HEXA|nr:unnamed protein product [Allacma fusca]
METYGKNIHVTLICPGPIRTPIYQAAFTHQSGETTERKPLQGEISENRMTSERCAFLSLVAIANKLSETWLSKLPILPTIYVALYLPVVSEFLTRLVFPSIVKRMKNSN